MNVTHHPRRCSRLLRALTVATVLAVGVTACSGAESPSSSDSSAAAPDPKKAATALDAGLEAHSAGDLTAAVADYETTLEYDPENKFALYNLALIDEARGNYGLAEEKYRAALETDPTYEPALFNLAILRTSRDPEEAISLYERTVAADSKDAAAWLNLGLLLRAEGQTRAGDENVLRAIGLDPTLTDPEAAS